MVYESTREIVNALRGGSDEEREHIIAELEAVDVVEGISALDTLLYDWPAWARDEQLAPVGQVWRFLFLRAGRAGGKTRAAAEMVRAAAGDPESCGGHIALVAPTYGDIRVTMVEGSSGILSISPTWDMPRWEPGYGNGGRLTWANGVEALCFTAERPDRIRGPEVGFVWGDEIAAWGINGMKVHDIMSASMRVGRMPRCVYTSTPKPTTLVEMLDLEARKEEKEIESGDRDPRRRTYIQRVWSTFANTANLPALTVEDLDQRYGGTTQGREQLGAELMLDDPDALWSQALIDRHKVTPDQVPELVRIIIAVDNATTKSKPGVIDHSSVQGRSRDVGSNDTAITGEGLGIDGDIYVFNDWTVNDTPARWGKRVLEAFAEGYRGQRANEVICEKNAGYDLIKRNLDVCMRAEGIPPDVVPINYVNARDGKDARAEPVHSAYERGRVHHVRHASSGIPGASGRLDDLEYQMTRFKRGRTGFKKDRVDSLVWGVTELIEAPDPGARQRAARARARALT